MANYRVMGIVEESNTIEPVVARLRQAGFDGDALSIIYPSPNELERNSDQADVAKGAIGGALGGATVGALAGLAAVALPGIGVILGAGMLGTAMAGAAAGGVMGAFSQIGLSDDLAASYQEALEEDHALFSIETPNPDRAAEAEHILREANLSLINTFQV